MVGHVHIYLDMHMKDVVRMIKDGSHATSCTVWACHLYLVAVGTLPEVQGVAHKNFTSLILPQFPLI